MLISPILALFGSKRGMGSAATPAPTLFRTSSGAAAELLPFGTEFCRSGEMQMITANRVQAITKLFQACSYKHDLYTVFSAWCECAAISLRNAADLNGREAREARYLEIVRKYDKETIETFPQIFGEVAQALEEGPQDILGQVFHGLELHNTARGQFFTPYPICKMMAAMLAGSPEEMKSIIGKRGYMLAQEPACGSGAMIIALAEAVKDAGFNYQKCLHVTAVDIDSRAVHMAYIQFTLLHIPAVVIVGDCLAMKFREEWPTLAHIMGGWRFKLQTTPSEAKEINEISPASMNFSLALPHVVPATAIDKKGQLSLF